MADVRRGNTPGCAVRVRYRRDCAAGPAPDRVHPGGAGSARGGPRLEQSRFHARIPDRSEYVAGFPARRDQRRSGRRPVFCRAGPVRARSRWCRGDCLDPRKRRAAAVVAALQRRNAFLRRHPPAVMDRRGSGAHRYRGGRRPARAFGDHRSGDRRYLQGYRSHRDHAGHLA